MPVESALPDGVRDFGLIETFLWTREKGYFLREGHRSRMKASAEALGFAFAEQEFDRLLEQACAGAKSARLRVRLVLSAQGAFDATWAPYEPEPEGKIWRVAVAASRFEFARPALAPQNDRGALFTRTRWRWRKAPTKQFFSMSATRSAKAREPISFSHATGCC